MRSAVATATVSNTAVVELPAASLRAQLAPKMAVWKRTTVAGGPIPVHGPKKLIDVDEAG